MKPKSTRSTMEVHVPHDVIFSHILPRISSAKSLCRFKCVSKEWFSFLTPYTFHNKPNLLLVSPFTVNILPRLPAKSIGRFKCLSKEWHSFLTSKMFQNMHMDHHKNNLKLLILFKTGTSLKFTTIDCEAPLSGNRLTGLLPRFVSLPPLGDIHILTSFHGLVCLGITNGKRDVGYSELILWNPVTNDSKWLSKSNIPKECHNTRYSGSGFGLYYSCCEDDYKLLFVDLFDNNVYIYSLRLDSWRKVDAFQHTSRLYPRSWSRGTYLNGNLYFLQRLPNRPLSSIIRFDTKTERFSKIETHHVDDDPDAYNYVATIVVKGDCIHVCVKYDTHISCDNGVERMTCIKLWNLDEYENMKEVLTYQLRPCDYGIECLNPFYLMKNGNWLMRNKFPASEIYEVALEKKMHITNEGKEKEKGKIYDDFEYAEVRVNGKTDIYNPVGDAVSYIETFVSPNRYMN